MWKSHNRRKWQTCLPYLSCHKHTRKLILVSIFVSCACSLRRVRMCRMCSWVQVKFLYKFNNCSKLHVAASILLSDHLLCYVTEAPWGFAEALASFLTPCLGAGRCQAGLSSKAWPMCPNQGHSAQSLFPSKVLVHVCSNEQFPEYLVLLANVFPMYVLSYE